MSSQTAKSEGPDREDRKLLGLEMISETAEYCPVAEDVVLLRKAGNFLADLPRVRGAWIEWALGHCAWRFLVKRACFGILSALYKFARRTRHSLSGWWPKARQELRDAVALLPLCRAALGRPVSTLVLAVDASGGEAGGNGGYGLVGTIKPQMEIRRELRWAQND